MSNRPKQVNRLAFRDISKYQRKEGLIQFGGVDVWVVTPKFLETKEARRMNRKLGLHKVNKFNNKNRCISK